MPTDAYDVVVIGAGIIGASSAFQLAQRGARVAVVESQSSFAEGSSGRSFASIRSQWADPLSIEIAWRSIQQWRDFEVTHGFDVEYTPSGYLLLYREEDWQTQLDVVELQRSFGVPVETLTTEEASGFSAFDRTGIGGATWGPSDGKIDPHAATRAFLTLAKQHGAEVRYRFPVDAIAQSADGTWQVGSGTESIEAKWIVNAAGGWASEIGALAGFEVPVAHSRRNIYSSAEGVTAEPIPMTVDVRTGVYLRSEGSRILIGGMKPDEVDGYNTALDQEWIEGLMEIADERFPWLLEIPIDMSASWAGTYENTPDYTVIVGSEPQAPTWVNACGASGHGIIQAPELGRMVAEQIIDGSIHSYDASPLSIERFRGARAAASRISMVF